MKEHPHLLPRFKLDPADHEKYFPPKYKYIISRKKWTIYT